MAECFLKQQYVSTYSEPSGCCLYFKCIVLQHTELLQIYTTQVANEWVWSNGGRYWQGKTKALPKPVQVSVYSQ